MAAWRPVTRRDVSTRRYADDALLAEAASFPLGTFPAVPGTAQYRLEFSGKRSAPWWQHATETNTTWTFTFSRPAEGEQELPPLLQVDYHPHSASSTGWRTGPRSR